MGTGLAAQLNASLLEHEKAKLVILVSPYNSLVDLAQLHFPIVPTTLLRYPLRTDEALSGANRSSATQLILIHGDKDTLIPIGQSAKLAAKVPSAVMIPIAGAGHNDLQTFPAYLQAIQSWVAKL